MASSPVVVIGGYDERAGHALDDVVDATRLSDGRIVVAQQRSAELRVFSAEGAYLTTWGGEGEGPGELQHILDVQRLRGDTLVVLSARPGVTVYDSTGSFVRSTRLSTYSGDFIPCRIGEGNWRILPDGHLGTILEDNFGALSGGCPPTPSDGWRTSGLVARRSVPNPTLDTVGLVPATERTGTNYRVFGGSLLVAWAPERAYLGDTTADSILVTNLRGDRIGAIPAPFDAVAIPLSSMEQERRSQVVGPGVVRWGDSYQYPTHFPRFGRLLVDAEGYLWVMAYPVADSPIESWRLDRPYGDYVEEGGSRWAVVDSTGARVASLRTPPGLFVFEIGADEVLGLVKDDLGVATVTAYAISR